MATWWLPTRNSMNSYRLTLRCSKFVCWKSGLQQSWHGTCGAGRWPRRQNGCLRTMADFKFRKFTGRTSHIFTLTVSAEQMHNTGYQVLKHPRFSVFAWKLKRCKRCKRCKWCKMLLNMRLAARTPTKPDLRKRFETIRAAPAVR